MCTRIGYLNLWSLLTASCIVSVASYCYVDIVDNGPIVKGGNITFEATVYDGDVLEKGSLKFEWLDTAVPSHKREKETQSPRDSWTVGYNASLYPAGRYVMQVIVSKFFFVIWAEICSARLEFYINETLNGNILLIQKNQTRPNIFVSNSDPVIHNISLKKSDSDFIKNASNVLTYWFIDCVYYGVGRDFIFPFNYTQPDQEHRVEALVVADFTPIPPPTTTPVPTTTTTKTTTTTTVKPSTSISTSTVKPTTTKTTTTTVAPINATVVKVKRDVGDQRVSNVTSKIMTYVNGTLQPYEGFVPFVCNSTYVATDTRKTYGYFHKKIKVKAPVSKVNVTGNNWLQHGDLLTLNVKCHGSKNLKYCVNYEKGVYNVTGKENCSHYDILEKCEFPIRRYFVEAMEHTIIIIITNEVSKVVTPVGVTVYKVKKQPQLSVIVVPVASSIVAVVLIVFGVAYYLQNRSRFVVEVADFNFGQNYSDMEYKTFKERLRDSIANAFFSRGPSPGSSEVPVWPPGRKYGSMTS